MAHSRSTQKRIRQNVRRHQINIAKLSRLRNTIRKTDKVLQQNDQEKAKPVLQEAIILIDKTAAFGLIHKNNAARKKSRLMRKFNKLATEATE